MGISSDGKKITRAINWGEPYTVLGLTASVWDAGTIVRSTKINKWSKHKPIRYNKLEPLTELERAGTVQDRVNGIYYGLKLANVGGQLDTLHNANFEYQRVGYDLSSGQFINTARMSDWDGYDHGAKPNPLGTIAEKAYMDLSTPYLEISIKYDEFNTTGVSLEDVFQTSGKHLKDYYPCALVTVKNHKFVHALWNLKYDLTTSSQYQGYTKIYDSGWYQQWALPLPKSITPFDGPSVSLDGGDVITVTVFFIESLECFQSVDSTDHGFRDWKSVDGAIYINNGYACPEAVAKNVELATLYTRGVDILDGTWRQSSGSSKLTVMLTTAWADPEEGATYTLTGTVYDSNNNSIGSVSFDFIKSDLLQICQMTCNSSLLLIPTTSVLKLSWELRCSLRPNKVCNYGTTELTYSEPTIDPWVPSN